MSTERNARAAIIIGKGINVKDRWTGSGGATSIRLVDAQQARRVLDRIVGYELSPVLWRKVKGGLSAGRVQSVAVRLIVEKEREIRNYVSTSTYKVEAIFKNSNGKEFIARLSNEFKSKDDAVDFLNSTTGSTFKVSEIVKKPSKKIRTPAPFTTSTLQQEASRKLIFSCFQDNECCPEIIRIRTYYLYED